MNLLPSTKNTKLISSSEFESYPSRLATATCSYFRAFGSHTLPFWIKIQKLGRIKYVEIKKYVVINFFISGFVATLLAYITIPQNKNYRREKLTTTNTLTSVCKVDLEKEHSFFFFISMPWNFMKPWIIFFHLFIFKKNCPSHLQGV